MTVNRADLLTPEIVQGLWQHMSQEFGGTLVNKSNAEEMQSVATALQLMGVMDTATFLENYTTTIGRTIYTPFRIGEVRDDGYFSLQSQVLTCGHEFGHILQFTRPNGGQFMIEYLTDPARRAAYETEAMITDLEVYHWLHSGNRELDPARKARGLGAYGCPPEDITVTDKALQMALVTVRMGGVVTEPGKKTIRFLAREFGT